MHDRLLDDLLRAMREDVQPRGAVEPEFPRFRLFTAPPRVYQGT